MFYTRPHTWLFALRVHWVKGQQRNKTIDGKEGGGINKSGPVWLPEREGNREMNNTNQRDKFCLIPSWLPYMVTLLLI